MSAEPTILLLSAAGVALVHTLLGPDHYVPFAALSASRRWSTARTVWITTLCGLGHVGSAIGLAILAGVLGWSMTSLVGFESLRGDVAAWLLLAFGIAYALYGLKRANRGRAHAHVHDHADGTHHVHEHDHSPAHLHPHESARRGPLAVWTLFIVFLFGPCEPLVPLLLVPAAQGQWATLAGTALVFSIVTIVAMVAAVLAIRSGWLRFGSRHLAEYSHAAAGATIACCGLAMLTLGL